MRTKWIISKNGQILRKVQSPKTEPGRKKLWTSQLQALKSKLWSKIPLSLLCRSTESNILVYQRTHLQSVQFSRSVVFNSLRPHESQLARAPCPSPTPGVYSNSCPSSRWCHPAISSSVVPFSSCPQSLPASGSFPMRQLFTWGAPRLRSGAAADRNSS